MHSIIFAENTLYPTKSREIRVTEKVDREGVKIYSRRRSFYKILIDEIKIPVNKLKLTPEIYIYKNIQDKRKFLSWRILGIIKLPQSRKKSCLLAYEHSFWILIKDNLI